jgi:hypothetical protein
MEHAVSIADERRVHRRFLVLAGLVVLYAFCLRAVYVEMAQVTFPIRGDVNQYVLYAWNLAHHGTFSTALPEASDAKPDSYRGPGYPLMLASTMLAAGHSDLPLRPGPQGTTALGYESDTWMRLALALQVLLGTATVGFSIAVARFWQSHNWALATGIVVAGWPHLVTFCGVLLSETLFAFLLLFSVWASCKSHAHGAKRAMAGAGFAWGATYLVNPVVAMFPPLIAIVLACRCGWRKALVFLACFAVLPIAWGLRNVAYAHDAGALRRMQENFVQGSWPAYHFAYNNRREYAGAREVLDDIGAETTLLEHDAGKGISTILDRMAREPETYLQWYMVDKPFLLWDWTLRIGWADIYFLPTQHSPYARIPMMKAMKSAYERVNPCVFGLAALAALGILGETVRLRGRVAFAPLVLCLLVVYLTAVHDVLQAEPRYSVPYRPEEVLLAIAALSCLYGWMAARVRQARGAGMPAAVGSSRMPRFAQV